jgi:hypothetical protein
MKVTVKEIRALLEGLPDDLPVEFSPISMAWLGASKPMRFDEIHFYNAEGGHAMPNDEGAYLDIHLVEDQHER